MIDENQYLEEEQGGPDLSLPTQTKYPMHAVIRTVVAFVLGLGTTWLIREIPSVGQLMQEIGPDLVTAVTNFLIVAAGGFYTWLMSRPRVNEFLTMIGLGATPASVIK